MKNKLFMVLSCLVLLAFAACNLHGRKIKYIAGTDTIESFGDGTYQLLSGSRESLYNIKYNSCIIQNVEGFQKTKDKVYLFGTTIQGTSVEQETVCSYKIYAVVELDSNHMTLCVVPDNQSNKGIYIYQLEKMIDSGDVQLITDLNELSEIDREVFGKID